jgi:hypothetical protein
VIADEMHKASALCIRHVAERELHSSLCISLSANCPLEIRAYLWIVRLELPRLLKVRQRL